MGYKRTPKLYHLKFGEDTDYPGLEVAIRDTSLGQFLAARATGADGDPIAGMVDLLIDRIHSWNLEDDQTGEPVPTTREAILGEDSDMIFDIVRMWQQAMTGVAAPLDDASPSGETSEEASIPMEALSPSLAS